ncbi:FusB/FusC family EF-G-binding protein [Caldalkalibacillus mannanilyticus]|uniref:FusB/FusC family EF-G-binding protein n=1 Tax=Caldalkalibacillus mannanilyticus TaxID=1418 RepID=UPI0009DED642|nr:FusB/FusC family EF-G-binding protein [Caldalkalibacillus mannanilyticus]
MDNNKNTVMEIEAFIRSDQYHFIKFQLKSMVAAHSTMKDNEILNAFKFHSIDKVHALFHDISESQREILNKLIEIEEEAQVRNVLAELKAYVIPFTKVTEKTVAKLFPKIKKLKAPPLEEIDFKAISYLGWYDNRINRKFMIAEHNGKLIGLQGTFLESQKGICSLCNGIEELGLFMSIVKSGKETYTSRGNYICRDSQKCNQNMITLDKLQQFIEVLKE